MSNEETNTPLTGDEPETGLELSSTTNEAVMALASATSELARALTAINYTPTDWVDLTEPDIDAAHLNKIEQGILQATTAINSAFTAINAINSNFRLNGVKQFLAAHSTDAPEFLRVYEESGVSHQLVASKSGLKFETLGDTVTKHWEVATKSDLGWNYVRVAQVDTDAINYSANESKTVSIPISGIPSGYSVLTIIDAFSTESNINTSNRYFSQDMKNVIMLTRNLTSASVSSNAHARLLCIKTD